MIGSWYNRLNLHYNASSQIKKWLKIGSSLNYLGEDLGGQIAAASNFKNVVNPYSMATHDFPRGSTDCFVGNIYLDLKSAIATLPATTELQPYTTYGVEMTLPAGKNTVRLTVPTGSLNLNWLRFTSPLD